MEWTEENFGALKDRFVNKYKLLEKERRESQYKRILLTNKKNKEGITPEESQLIEEACKYEDSIKEEQACLSRLRNNLINALDELDAKLNEDEEEFVHISIRNIIES